MEEKNVAELYKRISVKKILIIGGGKGGRKFCESILLYSEDKIVLSSNRAGGQTERLARQYGLPFILYSNLASVIEQFDVVILATPLGTKTQIFTEIIEWGYRNAVIFEKPLTLSAEHFEMLQSITKTYKISYTIAYNRRFSGLFFPVGENNYDISFPMVPRENVLIHNLPHALDMVIMLCGGINLSVENAQKSSGEYEIIGRCNNVTFRLLLFLDFSKKSKVKINGVEMEWPPLKSSYSMIDVVTSLIGRVPYENDEKERILLNSICKVEEMIHE